MTALGDSLARMSASVKFWDLDYAVKCVRGSEATADKLRKAELVRAVGALTWFIRGLPQGVPLLEEVRSLAGRVADGLDKPGAGYVDHPLCALRAQPELSPYSYSASLVTSGVPRAGPPQPGQVAAYSFVPDEVLPGAGAGAGGAGAARAARTAATAAEEVVAVVAALTGAEQDQLKTRGGAGADAGDKAAALAAAAVAATAEAAAATAALAAASQDSLLYTQEDEEQPGLSLFDLDKTPVIPAGQGAPAAGGDEGGAQAGDVVDQEEVSPPVPTNTDNLPAHYDVPIGAANDGSMIASAGSGPLGAGGAVGRTADQLQSQVGAQTQGDSAETKRPRKRAVCLAVRRGDVCRDKGCTREHPARCGDPLCFPTWRKDCQLWHVKVVQGRGQPSQQQQRREQQGRQQQRQLQQWQQQQRRPQARGNGAGANPGRAEPQKSQGRRPQPPGRRQGHQRQQQRQQMQQQHHPQVWLQQQQQPHHPGESGPLMWQGWQQQQQQQQGPPPPPPLPPWLATGPSFRDVVKGATGRHSLDQAQLLGRLAALERKLAELVCQPSHGMSQI